MMARRPAINWRTVALGLMAGAGLGLGGSVSGQHTPDPYNIVGEYNSQYEPYMYATYPTVAGTQPNQGRLEGRPGLRNSNTLQSFLDDE